MRIISAFDLLFLAAVILPPAAAHLASLALCRGFDALPAEARARRVYWMGWIVTLCILLQFGLPLLAVSAGAGDMPLIEAVGTMLLDAVALLAPLGKEVVALLAMIVTMAVMVGSFLLISMAWFRLDRLAKRNHGAASQQARLYLRGMVAGQLPMLAWLTFALFAPPALFDNPAFLILALVGFLFLTFSAAPFLTRLSCPTAPLLDAAIEHIARDLCRAAGVRVGAVRILKLGAAKVANAQVSGLLPWYRRIDITDRMLETFSAAEVRAILAHEIGHVKKMHLWWYLAFGLLGGLALPPLAGWLAKLFGTDGSDLLFFGLLMVYWGVVFAFCSRRFERQADRYAVELTGDRDAFAAALTKLAEVNCMTKKWSRWDIFQPHPDIARRLRDIGCEA